MWPNPRVPHELSSNRKKLSPPNGKPLIVHTVMNIEYWPFDKNMPRGILPPPHGKSPEPPDLPNYSWVEYGMRVGLPRLFKLFQLAKVLLRFLVVCAPSERSVAFIVAVIACMQKWQRLMVM